MDRKDPTVADSNSRTLTKPWIFLFTTMPFATAVGFVAVATPYWLARRGVSLNHVASITATAMLPHAFKFIWAPLVDAGSKRKLWYVWMTSFTAGLLVLCNWLLERGQFGIGFVVAATLLQVTATTSEVASDGLMALAVSASDRGKAGGWRMTGNVGGTGLVGALAIRVASFASVNVAGVILALLVVLSCMTLPLIHVNERAAVRSQTSWLGLRTHLRDIIRDVMGLVRTREGWSCWLICILPVGTGGITGLFSAMAVEYHASERVVVAVNGFAGGLVSIAGSLIGGWIADRIDRRVAYLSLGMCTAIVAGIMAFLPLLSPVYAIGTLLYSFVTATAFSALAALILESVQGGIAASSKFSIFIGTANIGMLYVLALDGWVATYTGYGARASFGVDAVLSVIGVLVASMALQSRKKI